jgi:uncharacterized protein (DUF1501 family)
LNEGRDLAITTDFRAVLCALSERHMRIPDQALEKFFHNMLRVQDEFLISSSDILQRSQIRQT